MAVRKAFKALLRVPVLASPPTAAAGAMYVDSGSGMLYYYNGSTWTAVL